MFDDLDIDKLIADDAERNANVDVAKNHGSDEAKLDNLRNKFLKESINKAASSVNKIEQNTDEVSDEGSILKSEIDEVTKRLEEEEKAKNPPATEEENTDVESEEEVTEEDAGINKVDEVADVESEANTPNPQDEWKRKEEQYLRESKEKDDLIMKFYQASLEKKEVAAPVVEKPVVKTGLTKDELTVKAKEIFEKLSYAEEGKAAEMLAELLSAAQESKEPVVKEKFTKEEFKQYQKELEAEVYAGKFEVARDSFFETAEGKKIVNDEDLFDLYKTKLNRLQSSGVHLNPEDLFKQAYEKTVSVFGAKETQVSSTAKQKVVPKVSDSLKEDVSKVEEAKKHAVKPSSSSNAGVPAQEEKFDQIAMWKKMVFNTTGQKI